MPAKVDNPPTTDRIDNAPAGLTTVLTAPFVAPLTPETVDEPKILPEDGRDEHPIAAKQQRKRKR